MVCVPLTLCQSSGKSSLQRNSKKQVYPFQWVVIQIFVQKSVNRKNPGPNAGPVTLEKESEISVRICQKSRKSVSGIRICQMQTSSSLLVSRISLETLLSRCSMRSRNCCKLYYPNKQTTDTSGGIRIHWETIAQRKRCPNSQTLSFETPTLENRH